MEYVYAALLLHRLKKDITEENVKKVVQATGVPPDEIKVKALVSALSEVNIEEAIKTPIAAPVATATPPATQTAGSPAAAKQEEKEEKKEEEALAGLSSLFG